MQIIREKAARFYDLQNTPTTDIPFYRQRLCSPSERVLELGCGTGRVLVPLSEDCAYILGIDSSPAMLELCQAKLDDAGIPTRRAELMCADVCTLNLDAQFDLITAPFRVLQNLETDAEVDGFMGSIARYLATEGRAVLNAFQPSLPRDVFVETWCAPGESPPDAEVLLPNGNRLVRHVRKPRLKSDPLIVYPELIYRLYSATDDLFDETVLPIAMRCWYPDEMEDLILSHGFRVLNRWGGYEGEAWGQGPELVIEFRT